MTRNPSFPYVFPFVLFLAFLGLAPYAPVPEGIYAAIWLLAVAGALYAVSRPVLDFRVRQPLLTVAIGVAVFVVWIGPDVLIPGYRSHWLFQNSITGKLTTSLSAAARANYFALVLRSARAILVVPILEELFWRAWLMRWLIRKDFQSLPLGAYSPSDFWIVAALFAMEHGPYWDVGLAAGVIYNWYMIRTRSLGDLILAHAITNGVLCAYVVATGKWEYWL